MGVLTGAASGIAGGGAGRGAGRRGAAFFATLGAAFFAALGAAFFAALGAALRFVVFLAALRAPPRLAAALRVFLAATFRPFFLVAFLFFALAMMCLLFGCQLTGLSTRWRHRP